MKKLILLAVLLLVVAVSGCTAPGVQTAIKSPAEASKAVTNISTQLDKVSSTFDSIDKALG